MGLAVYAKCSFYGAIFLLQNVALTTDQFYPLHPYICSMLCYYNVGFDNLSASNTNCYHPMYAS